MDLVIKASNFAAIKHKDQRRSDPSGTPYINHPIGVANILINEGFVSDPVVLQAALLHDTVEDTETTFEELEQEFGLQVTGVVREVTDNKELAKAERKRLQVENAAKKSDRAKLVKLADKLYNVRDLDRATPIGWSDERKQEYIVWAHKVVAGLRGSNANMEAELDKLFTKYNVQ